MNKHHQLYPMKNWNKLKTEADRNYVRTWSKITTVTINDEGLYICDMVADPGFKEAKMAIKDLGN